MNVIGDAGSHLLIRTTSSTPPARLPRRRLRSGQRRQSRVRLRRPRRAVGPAIDRIEKSPIDKMIVTNTIPQSKASAACDKMVVLSVARLLGQAIKSIHEETSVSSLFV
jgi:hypothetical protein